MFAIHTLIVAAVFTIMMPHSSALAGEHSLLDPPTIEDGWYAMEPYVFSHGKTTFEPYRREKTTTHPPPPERLDKMWKWVVAYYERTEGPLEDPRPPNIAYVDRYAQQRLGYSQAHYWFLRDRVAYEIARKGKSGEMIDARPELTYSSKLQILFLKLGADYTDPRHDAGIVHEMYHHAQNIAGEFDETSCVAHLEPDAYRAANAWMRETGVGEPIPKEDIGWIVFSSGCAREAG